MFLILAIITLIFEAALAIPVLGGSIVIGTGYTALFVMGVLHIIIAIIAPSGKKFAGVFGIIATCLAWIPILGWLLHVLVAVAYFIAVIRK